MRCVVGVVVMLAATSAYADAQLATDAAPKLRCTHVTRLVGHAPGAVARVMKERELTPIALEMIVVPQDVQLPVVTSSSLVKVRIGAREVHGIVSNLSGDGCIRPDHRHAIDRAGNVYQFDGPAGVVDYNDGRCHTARGWQRCEVVGQTKVMYVVPDPRAKLAGVFGSNLAFYPIE